MAELDPALQDEISNLQARHTALVDAVRNYSGGSIAQATNDLLAAQAQTESTIDDREAALLGLIQRNTVKSVPSLLLDFVSQVYMQGTRKLEHGYSIYDLIPVTRETSAWVFGAQGNIIEVAPDTAAYHYDPVTGEPLGLLQQPSRTNLLPWSETDGANWAIWNGDRWANTPTKMRGVTLDRYIGATVSVKDTPSSSHVASWSVFFYDGGEDASSNVVIRGEIRGDSISARSILFDYTEKAFSINVTTGIESWKAVDLGGGLYHVTLTIDNPDVSNVTDLRTSIYGDNKWLGGFQLEESPYAGPYIRTTASSVTVARDTPSRTLGSEYNPMAFTAYFDGDIVGVPTSGFPRFFSLHGGDTQNEAGFRNKAGGVGLLEFNANGSPMLTRGVSLEADVGDSVRVAFSVTKDWITVVENGVVRYDDINAAGVVPDLRTLSLGQGVAAGGVVPTMSREVRLYTEAKSASELQGLTS